MNKKKPDGSNWTPLFTTRVCSVHFVTGKHNSTRGHVDYVPSIFPDSSNSVPLIEEDKDIKCKKCDYKVTTSNLMALRIHSFSKHFICFECQLYFETKEETVEHMVSFHQLNVQQCEFCSYICLDPTWLDYHLSKKHPQAGKHLLKN